MIEKQKNLLDLSKHIYGINRDGLKIKMRINIIIDKMASILF